MLRVRNLSFSYQKKKILKNISFDIQKGENVSLIGASGCGKSTLLQSIYGLHHVKGKIWWNDKQLLGPSFNIVPGEDFIKYLAQDFDLMPPLTVAENVGKYLSNMYPRKKQHRVNQLLDLVEMRNIAKVKAGNLSGGEQQRVALARVLANPPEVLLLDEPFSHIDHFRKNKLRRNLFSHLKQENVTVIVATHDSTDALSFADRTLVMQRGKIVANGHPQELYEDPKDVYTGSLFGEINEVPVKFFLPKEKEEKKVIIYPHEIRISEEKGKTSGVKNAFFKGGFFLIEVEVEGETLFVEHPVHLEKGQLVELHASEEILKKRIKKG